MLLKPVQVPTNAKESFFIPRQVKSSLSSSFSVLVVGVVDGFCLFKHSAKDSSGRQNDVTREEPKTDDPHQQQHHLISVFSYLGFQVFLSDSCLLVTSSPSSHLYLAGVDETDWRVLQTGLDQTMANQRKNIHQTDTTGKNVHQRNTFWHEIELSFKCG